MFEYLADDIVVMLIVNHILAIEKRDKYTKIIQRILIAGSSVLIAALTLVSFFIFIKA